MSQVRAKGALWAVGMLVVVGLAGLAQAAGISAVGTIANDAGNEATQWRTTGTAKTLDADGDNVYGSSGYDMLFLQGIHAPFEAFVTLGGGINGTGPWPGYAVVDNPQGGDIQLKTATGNTTPGTVRDVITYRLTGSIPASGIRMGVMTDGLDGPQFASKQITLTQTAGPGAGATATIDVSALRNQTPDMAFFDITGGQVNDQFTLRVLTSDTGHPTAQVVTWDTIPNPAPLQLMSVDIQGTGGVLVSGAEPNYGYGKVWNAFTVAHHAGTSTNPSMPLVDSEGNPTGAVFAIQGTVSGYNAGMPLINDYLFVQAGNADRTVDWSITGLNPDGLYELYGYGAVGRDIVLTLDQTGQTQQVTRTGFAFDPVWVGQAGELTGTAAGPGAEGNWSGLQLRLIAVPEPATLALVGLAAGGLGGYLRKRRG